MPPLARCTFALLFRRPLWQTGGTELYALGNVSTRVGLLVRCAAAALFAAAVSPAADPPALEPVTACEVFQNLAANTGKTLVVLGRYSFRQNGRTLSEMKCGPAGAAVFDVIFDPKTAPKPAGPLVVDAPVAYKKLAQVKTTTPLGKIPFGSTDYDRWAFIYGRVEEDQPAAQKQPAPAKRPRIVCTGEALVVSLNAP